MSRRAGRVLLALALAAATLAVYAPVREYPFLNYDDNTYVSENPVVIEGLSRDNLEWALTTDYHGHWHPLTWLSHMADVELFGLEPAGHHLVNLALHLATTLLLFAFLLRSTGAAGRSVLVAGLFALHPLHVESVAWVSDRKDLLAGFFWTLGLVAYARYAHAPSVLRYAAVLVAYGAGLLSKSMVVTLPAVLLLLDFWPLRRWPAFAEAGTRTWALRWARLLGEKALLLAVGVVVIGYAAAAMTDAFDGVEPAAALLPRYRGIEEAITLYAAYLAKTVLPVGLAVPYPREPIAFRQVAAAALVLLAISLPALRLRHSRPWWLVGWLWFLIALLPVIGLLRSGPHSLADRYTYIPLTGIFVWVVWGAADLAARWRVPRAALGGAALLVLGACSLLSAQQLAHWRSSEALFEHALAVTENNAEAHHNLATTLFARGRHDEAGRHLDAALRIWPEYDLAHFNLGILRTHQKRFEEALVHFERAHELEPRSPKHALMIARTHEALGHANAAFAWSEKARFLHERALREMAR